MAQGHRPDRVGDQIRQELSDLLSRGVVHDPGIGFITLTRVKMSPDLQLARVFYTMMGDESARRDTATALERATPALAVRVIEGLNVDADRMRANVDATHGALFSQLALLALVESGRSRDEAYRIVQEGAQRAWREGIDFRELLGAAAPELDLDSVFDPAAFVRHAEAIVARLDSLSG